MPLTAGARLGSYEIVSPLGAGGMGEVYRARDTKLNRDVALKILPDVVAGDPDRLARFQREAQVLASLNHPNIAAIYGVEDSGPTHALVLELVEGPTLADRLSTGALPVAEALAIARQIADALAAAHEAGVIHRDLKPANVKVRPDGAVKVLDFGLAKALGPDPASSSAMAMNSPTITGRATDLGIIIGTAAYMSPEQARGKPVDRRADLWAFGVVLYEMLTGRRAFEGPEISDVLAAVLRDTPPLDALPPGVSPAVRRLLRRTLEKDRARRLDSMLAARLELDDIDATLDVPTTAPSSRTSARWLLMATAATAIVAALLTGVLVWRARQPAPAPVLRFAIVPTPDAPIAVETNHSDLSLTPDGSRLLYFSRAGDDNQFVLRPLDRFEPVILKNLGEAPRGLTVSPDGAWIAYQAGGSSGADAALYKVPIAGGSPIRLCEISGNLRGVTWPTPDTMVFASVSRESGLLRISTAGGAVEVLTKPRTEDDEVDHLWPQALPDGKHVLFGIVRSAGWDIGLLSLDTKTWRVLIRNGISPRYSPTGHIVFGSGGVLKAVPFDLSRAEITGEPVQVLAGVIMKDSGAADFAFAGNGTLVYLPGQVRSLLRMLSWRDTKGQETSLAVAPADFTWLKISPDGRFAASIVGMTAGVANGGLWLIDLTREVASRLTPLGSPVRSPVWSPDGHRIAFWRAMGASGQDPGGIFVMSAAGTTPPERLTTAAAGETQLPGSWGPDGNLIFTSARTDKNQSDIMQVSVTTGDVKSVVTEQTRSSQPALSPDGHWLAYTSTDLFPHLFVRPFPNVNDVKIPVTDGPGQDAAWSADDRTLFYHSGASLRSVPVTPFGGSLTIGRPVEAIRVPQTSITDTAVMATPPVNNRFLVATPPGSSQAPAEYRVVLNWFDELKALVPATKK
ncbi:MAG TPA: protein kinase [Vicinamibacterales bacterium]|nr:protein kinase [Vicinamibacterales bacterium]